MKEYRPNNIVSAMLARELKSAGFVTYECIGIYKGEDYYPPESDFVIDSDNYSLHEDECLAPKMELVYDWVRKVLSISVSIAWEYADHGITDRVKTRDRIYYHTVNSGTMDPMTITIMDNDMVLDDIHQLQSRMESLIMTAIHVSRTSDIYVTNYI